MAHSFIRGVALLCILPVAQTAWAADQARLTVGMPAYVTHPDHRTGTKGWNQGWLNNEGVLADITWPVASLTEHTTFRAGATAGGFDNSIGRLSVFAGGVAEIETYATKDLAFSLGTYAGAITGYDNAVDPAMAPYIGTSYALTDRVEIGAREFWLPAKTIGGSSAADSDAYVTTITVGTRF